MGKKKKRKGISLNNRYANKAIQRGMCHSCGGRVGRKGRPAFYNYLRDVSGGGSVAPTCALCAQLPQRLRDECYLELRRILRSEIRERGFTMSLGH